LLLLVKQISIPVPRTGCDSILGKALYISLRSMIFCESHSSIISYKQSYFQLESQKFSN